jgi:hypothetical protein
MPKFETLTLSEAQLQSATGKRAQLMREYLGYIDQLKGGQAGSLQASADETLTAIRRRLNAAAKQVGKELTVRRTADRVYFWVARGRGRPRKAAQI